MEHMGLLTALSVFYAIVTMYATGYLLYRFAKPFLENKKGAVCIGVAYFVTMLILYLVPVEINTFAAYSLGILSAFLAMCRIDRRNYKQKTFIAATFFSLHWLSEYMTRIITDAIYHIKVVSDAFYIPEKHLAAKIFIFGGVELLDTAMGFAILGISVRYIVKTCVYKREDMSIKEMFMLIVPSITGITGYGILIQYQTSSGMSWMEPIYGLYNGLAFLHFGISIITIVVMTVLFQNIKARQEEKLQNELLAAQVDSIKKHIGQVESLYRNIRSIRHDMAYASNQIFIFPPGRKSTLSMSV